MWARVCKAAAEKKIESLKPYAMIVLYPLKFLDLKKISPIKEMAAQMDISSKSSIFQYHSSRDFF